MMENYKTSVLAVRQNKGSYFRYFSSFVQACLTEGISKKCDIWLPHRFRAFLGRLISINLSRIGGRLIVCGSHRIESVAWPWCYCYEIVPMMWDMWPGNYTAFIRYVKKCRVRLAFVSARDSVDVLSKACPNTRFVWLPEAGDLSLYSEGPALLDRGIDILCYGRQVGSVYDRIVTWASRRGVEVKRGAGDTFEELVETLRRSKISICYPQCDTNPAKAGGVETTTLRYWEAMQCGTLMIGRAPQELIEVCGYNPVIELGDNLEAVLSDVFDNLDRYQKLAKRNVEVAAKVGDYKHRMWILKKGLGV